MKTCCVCKIEKDISEFTKRSDRKDAPKYKCKLCDGIYAKEYIKTHPKTKYARGRKKEIKEWFSNFKKQPCLDCKRRFSSMLYGF